jgi:hypothetical protein
LAFAMQNDLPIVADSCVDMSRSIFDGYVTTVSLIELVTRRRYYRGAEFRAQAEQRAAAWRQRYPMRSFMREALSVVPGALKD